MVTKGWSGGKELIEKGQGTLVAYINVLYLGYGSSYMTAYMC